ncbi:MAG: hypothetical protein R2788_15600 [Saprospiraceae bacterium]
MKKFVLFLLVLFLVIGVTFPSCIIDDDIDCNCPPITGGYFRILDLDLTNYSIFGFKPTQNSTISHVDFLLRINIGYEFYACTKPDINKGFSLINSALACSCIYDGIYGAKEKIEEIVVITKNDFSNDLLAGDTINQQMEILDYFFGEKESLQAFVGRDDNLLQFDGFELFLKNAPQLDSLFEVEIKITLDNGEEFTIENEPVIIE